MNICIVSDAVWLDDDGQLTMCIVPKIQYNIVIFTIYDIVYSTAMQLNTKRIVTLNSNKLIMC